MEIWKTIKEFEDYQVSNLGNVKSLKFGKERILIFGLNSKGYYNVTLCKNSRKNTLKVHQLVAIAFLNHVKKGMELVVNHKNFIRTDNRVENLELVTARENANQKHLKSTSKYTGVCWSKQKNKWVANIVINKKLNYLGYFANEYDAHLAYEKELLKIKNKKS